MFSSWLVERSPNCNNPTCKKWECCEKDLWESRCEVKAKGFSSKNGRPLFPNVDLEKVIRRNTKFTCVIRVKGDESSEYKQTRKKNEFLEIIDTT